MKWLTFPVIALFIVLPGLCVQAQIPQKFNYQAIVRGNAGVAIVNKPLGLRFTIRDGSATGGVLYSETQLTTTNTYGLVNLQVGAGTAAVGAFAAITWGTGSKFLQVEVDTTGSANYVQLATVELITVPYALEAQQALVADSARVAGRVGVADSAKAAGKAGIADSAKVAGKAGLADSARAANRSVIADSARAASTAVNANSAVNATTAAAFSGALAGDVGGSQNATVIQAGAVTAAKIATGEVVKSLNGVKDNVILAGGGGTSLSVAGNTITVNGASGTITGVTAGAGLTGGGTSGNVTLAPNFFGDGFVTLVPHADHTHTGQSWTSASGNTLSLQTSSADFNSLALEAAVLNSSSQAAAIFGQTLSTNSASAGVVGQASGNGGAAGVLGIGFGNGTYAIEGAAQGTGSYAGVFDGNVIVTGTLSKGAGNFKIDHPLDPANKYLYHSFVESPDMMNIYNGNIVLDGNGEATVTMPDWFEALNRDFRYQLTAMGKPSPNLYIAREISGNRFRIAGGSPGAKVSWTVTGIRHDAYANAHRIPVEEQKPAEARGRYLNPEAFGKARQQSIYGIPVIRARKAPGVSLPVHGPAGVSAAGGGGIAPAVPAAGGAKSK